MKIKSFVFSDFVYAGVLALALVALSIGFSMPATTGEQSKLIYDGNLWCVSNYIEQRPIEYLKDGRPRKDKRLDDKVDWIRKEQVEAENKEEAEQKATNQYFKSSNAEELRGWLDANDKDNFVTHFNTGATTPGPCIGSGFGNGVAGKWVNDGINEDCFGISANTGSCKVSSDPIELVGKGSVEMPASGKIVQESHLVTKEEGFQPSSTSDRIEEHYRITQEAIGMTFTHRDKWTPAEGGGSVGQGSASPPPASVEPWVMNMYWKNKPAEGTRVIITNPANGKSVVAAAGYETGPSTEYLFGAQEEVMQTLGVVTGSTVTVGFAKDQSLRYGPIDCTTTESTAATSSSSGSATGSVAITEEPTTGSAKAKDAPGYCPDEPMTAGPSIGEDYQLQIAKQYEQELSRIDGIDSDTDSSSEGASGPYGQAEGLGATANPGGAQANPSFNSCHGKTPCHPREWFHHNAIYGDAVDIDTDGKAYAAFDGTAVARNYGNPHRKDLVGVKLTSTNGEVVAHYVHVISTKTGPVKAGEVIGNLYPLNSGGHIHFELQVNGRTVHGDRATRGNQSAYVKSLWNNMKKVLGL